MKRRNFHCLLWLLGATALLLSGCAASVEKTRRPDSDWSRGLLLGRDASGPADLAFDPQGGLLWAIWPTADGERLRRVALNVQGEVVRDADVSLKTRQNRSPRLLFTPQGAWLMWIGRLAGEADRVWIAPAEAPDRLQGVSPSGAAVKSADLTALPDGRLAVGWDSKTDGGVYVRLLEADGLPAGEPVQVDVGSRPALAAAADGTLRLAWVTRDEAVRYAVLDGRSLRTLVMALARPPERSGGRLNALDLAVHGEQAVLLWSVVFRSGEEAGTAYTDYVVFSGRQEEPVRRARLWVPIAEHPQYRAVGDGMALARLAPPATAGRGSEYVEQPRALAAPDGTFWFAVAVQQALRLDRQMQVVIGVLRDGEFVGVQPVTRTDTISRAGVPAMDAQGHLHLVWSEGAAGTHVFYATTAPEAAQRLNRLTAGDVVEAVTRGGLESLAGMALFPIALVWLMPGLLVAGLWSLLGWAYLDRRPAWLGLGVAVAAYQAAKWLFLPTLRTYVPFSAWLDVSPIAAPLLRVGVPALIFLLAMWLAHRAARRWGVDSVAAVFLLLAGSDALLTLAVYGVNLMGVF